MAPLNSASRTFSPILTPLRATVGLGAVIALLAACGIWVAIGASNAVDTAKRDHQVSDSYEAARYALAAEESDERKYRLEPSAEVRQSLAASATQVAASLENVAARGDRQDRAFAVALTDGHTRYLQATLRMLDAVDSGDASLVLRIDGEEVDPAFDAIQERLDTEAASHAAAAARSLAHVASLQRDVLIASPFVLILSLALLGTFWSSLQRSKLDVLRAEQRALATSESRFRGLVQNSFDPVLLLDVQGRVLYSSPAVQRLWGYDDVTGLAVASFVEPGDRARADEMFDALLARPGATATGELKARNARGERVDLEVTGSNLLDDPSVGGVVINCHDVTERRRVEAQLLQSQKMESIGRLAGGVAHDFNNLLTAIIGFCELAGGSIAEGHPARADVAEAVKAANKAADLTRQLLAFARQQVVNPQDSDVNELVRDIRPLLGRLLGEEVELLCPLSAEPLVVRVDRSQFGQVLLNLAVNAADAMPAGGKLTIESRRVVLDEAYCATRPDVSPGAYAVVSVTDSGVGIAPDVLPHIFEPFFTTKSQGKGTGLGLATCYGIARQARGHIAVYSELGYGTTFKVHFPLAAAQEAEAGADRSLEARERRGSEVVLLVEDQESVRKLTARVLAANGYHVLSAADPFAALEIARRTRNIALIVSDVVMPGMDGIALIGILDGILGPKPVLLMSGYAEESIMARVAGRPGISLLSKPVGVADLLSRVRETLSAAALPVELCG